MKIDLIDFPSPIGKAADAPIIASDYLSPELIVSGYLQGFFPWPSNYDKRIVPWYSPDPRGVLFINDFKVSKSLQKAINKKNYTIKYNQNFLKVIQLCQSNLNRKEGSWINDLIVKHYHELFKLKLAFSVETYQDDQLVGGLYGVQLGHYRSGESMFYLAPNASKIAFYYLIQSLKEQGIQWIDTQMTTPLVKKFGGKNLPRQKFLELLNQTSAQFKT